ncbi:MAG: hypothetical protein KBD10_00790 [Candidatus Pacebacteria bacterium]|nr:hypothetical protein [Candidatus Paceibacterota bacterium]
MKIKRSKIFLLPIILFSLIIPFFSNAQLNTESQDTEINLIVEGCNDNLICEAVIGENTSNCPLDCPVVTPPVEEDVQEDSSVSRKSSVRKPVFETDIFSNKYFDLENITIVIEHKNVFLSWKNPNQIDFDFVRVMKNDFYTESPFDGVIVYEGIANNFLDHIDEFDKNYYYSFFAKYKDNNFSKGVNFVVNSKNPFYTEEKYLSSENPLNQVFFNPELNIFEFYFTQDNQPLSWEYKILQAQSASPIKIYLPKKDFFGPIDDVFIYADFYDIEKNFLKQEIFKMDYNPGLERYETEIKNIIEGQKIYFDAILIDEKNKESKVSGIININKKIPEEMITVDSCLGESVGWRRILMYFECDFRLAILLLIALLITGTFIRKIILKKS